MKTQLKTKEEYLESDIAIGLIRQLKRARDLLLQFDCRENKRQQWKAETKTQHAKNESKKNEIETKRRRASCNNSPTGELELQRLDAEKLSRAHWILADRSFGFRFGKKNGVWFRKQKQRWAEIATRFRRWGRNWEQIIMIVDLWVGKCFFFLFSFEEIILFYFFLFSSTFENYE